MHNMFFVDILLLSSSSFIIMISLFNQSDAKHHENCLDMNCFVSMLCPANTTSDHVYANTDFKLDGVKIRSLNACINMICININVYFLHFIFMHTKARVSLFCPIFVFFFLYLSKFRNICSCSNIIRFSRFYCELLFIISIACSYGNVMLIFLILTVCSYMCISNFSSMLSECEKESITNIINLEYLHTKLLYNGY